MGQENPMAPSRDLLWSLATSPPWPFSFPRAGRLQPPLPPRPCAGRPCRRLPRPRSRLLSHGLPSVSRGDRRRRVPAVVQWRCRHYTTSSRLCRLAGAAAVVVAILPRHRRIALHPGLPSVSPERRRAAPAFPSASLEFLRQPLPPCPCAGRRRRLHLRHRSGKVALGLASPPPEHRRCPSSSSPFILAGSSSRGAASVVGFAAARSTSSPSPCSCRRLPSSPPRRPRASSSSSSRRSRSSWRSSLRRAILVRRPRSSSEPLQPRRRLRPRLRIVKRCAGRVSPSSKDRRRSHSLTVRLRLARSSLSFPRLVAWWLVALLVCFA
ncbi:pre-mRNA-splicing factor CWC22-like [Oryza sativa Japonica Group]|uniref:pre-mRNA-splicing factor CWC22-like n=1 Tax=Oryza sativa subsp. japonica TaxID=39947 RepID=UPI00339BDC45